MTSQRLSIQNVAPSATVWPQFEERFWGPSRVGVFLLVAWFVTVLNIDVRNIFCIIIITFISPSSLGVDGKLNTILLDMF